jgi:hypothetical protein
MNNKTRKQNKKSKHRIFISKQKVKGRNEKKINGKRKTKRTNKVRKRKLLYGGSPYKLERGQYIMVDGTFELDNITPNILTTEYTIKYFDGAMMAFKNLNMTSNVGEMYGCYCPPHKGHFENIKEACEKLDLKVLFLHTNNRNDVSRSRHGIPADFSVKQLCIFAKYLYDTLDLITFISSDGSNATPWEITSDLDNFYNISGTEYDGKESYEKALEYKTKEEKGDPLKNVFPRVFKNFERSTPEKKQTKMKNIVFLRNKNDGLSATKFTECLISIKDVMETDIPDKKTLYEKCYNFLPDFYTETMKYDYINDTMEYKDFFR